MRVYHLTTVPVWDAAVAAGVYDTSTRDRSLAEEGYVHCAEAHQVEAVRSRWFGDVPDLLVLEVDTDLLGSPWRTEQPAGADQAYPHVYGPLDLGAVVGVHALGPDPVSDSDSVSDSDPDLGSATR